MKSERGQGIAEGGLILLMLGVVAVFAYLALMPTIQGALQNIPNSQAVAMPQVSIPNFTDHAQDRHSDVIASATTCFSGYGTISPQSMHNPLTNRDAWVCQLDGKFFIWITKHDNGDTVTMFQNKAKCLLDAIKYLTNAGYE
jgi:hypothetical protein